MKQKFLLKTMLLLCALIAGSSSVWAQSDYSDIETSNCTLTGVTSGSTCTVNGQDGIKVGTSSNGGAMKVTVPAGAKYLHVHVAAWKGVTGLSLNITPNTNISPTSISLTANTGIANSSPFTFEGTDKDESNKTYDSEYHYKVITFTTALTEETEFTFTTSTSKRFVIWGVNYESAGVSSLAIKTAPTKTRYEVGETLDMTGFVLNADGNDVSSGYTMTMGGAAISNGATLSSAGKKTITVAYGGKTVDQAISVGAVTGISVTTPPTKTSYDTGDSFDPTGMVVTASLSTGELSEPDTWTKAVTGYTIDPEDDLAPANTYVTITYATKTTTQAITVTDVAVTGVSVKASTTIEKTKTETLTPTITPANATNKAVTWESDNPSVATVSAAGVVTAVAAGTANITVTTNNGGKTATCVVTVVNQKGGADAPYSVADVKDGTASGTNKYFTGYIVGNYNSKAPVNPATTDTNFALADSPNETNGANTIPVELPSGSIRTNWGPNSNNVIGYKVLIKGNKDTYFSVNGIKSPTEITAVSVAIKPGKTYTTLTSAYNLDFTSVSSGLKAYIATSVSAGSVQMIQVNKVPAGTGLVLKATTPGTAVNIPVFDGTSPDDVSANKMAGSATATTAIAANGGYILKDGVFQPATAGTLAAGKAYLAIAVSSASELTLDFEGGATGIDSIENGTLKIENGEVYNLAGQRVAQPTKGLYIVNGKKVVIR